MEQMLICLSLALIAGLLMSRAAKAVRLPAVTAYLLTGLLLGPFFLGRLGLSRFGFGFGSLAAVEGYGILTQVALGFIAFVIGNEFRLSALKHMGRRAVTVGVAQAVITTALVDIALVALHFARPDVISLASAITLGSIAAATAPAATLMVVKQYKADGPLTKLLLMVVAIDDAVGLVLFSASYGVANALEQGRIDPMSVVLELLLEIALSVHDQVRDQRHPLRLLAAAGVHDDRHRVLQRLPHLGRADGPSGPLGVPHQHPVLRIVRCRVGFDHPHQPHGAAHRRGVHCSAICR